MSNNSEIMTDINHIDEKRKINKKPGRHEHQSGAPLTKDCDNWCKCKYENWVKRKNHD